MDKLSASSGGKEAAEQPVVLPRSVRVLQWLVIGLTASMIVGVITMVAVVVTRFPSAPPRDTAPRQTELTLPDGLVLPQGTSPSAVTLGRDWIALVVEDASGARILIYARDSGALLQSLEVQRAR